MVALGLSMTGARNSSYTYPKWQLRVLVTAVLVKANYILQGVVGLGSYADAVNLRLTICKQEQHRTVSGTEASLANRLHPGLLSCDREDLHKLRYS